MKKKILIFAGYYIPSVKAGGPVQSIKNIVDHLNEYFDFFILANDRDISDEYSFDNIKLDQWEKVGLANVMYVNYANLSVKKMAKIINDLNPEILYLNSFFEVKLSFFPVLLKKFNLIKVETLILAPRGNFSKGALELKKWKKKIFIDFSKHLKLHKRIIWHATASKERSDIEAIFGNKLDIRVSSNLTENYTKLIYDKTIDKVIGELKIAFISRVHPKKNLLTALLYLKNVIGKVEFNIYGPIEDKIYWEKCKHVIEGLPNNISVKYHGHIAHDEIVEKFKLNHILLFPTLGENFGHVISEALVGGCPVIISDQTPWVNLVRKKIGWDIPLDNEDEFVLRIQECIDLNDVQYNQYSINAFEYGKNFSNRDEDISSNIKLFS